MAAAVPAGHPRRLIWFCSTEYVAENPQVLPRLRDEIGLTTLMPESHICHTSGFRASPELAARGPFEDWRSRAEQWPQARDGIYPPVAGVVGGFDDTPLLAVIEACRRSGLEVWGHLGLWSYGGEVYPEYAMQDLEGRPLDRRYQQWGIGLCPSHPRVREWTRDCLVDVARRYDLDGFCVDHARYPAPANLHSLLACGCPWCQQEAGRLGFDFPQMRDGVLRLAARVGRLRAEQVRRFRRANPGLGELVAWLGEEAAALDWFRFRATLLAARMREFREAVRQSAGPGKVFGSDVFPPSIALLGGQLYSEWEKGADFLTGGSSAGGVVGWASGVTNLATEWAPALRRSAPGLAEEEALGLVYQLFGCEDLGLPTSVEGLRRGPLPVVAAYARELDRLQAGTSGGLPLYPPLSAGGGLELVRQLAGAVVERGCDGAMLVLDPEQDQVLAALGEVFGRWA